MAPRASARQQRQAQRRAAAGRPYVRPAPEVNTWLPASDAGLGPPERIPPVNANVGRAAKRPIADSIDLALGPGQVEVEMRPGPHADNIGESGWTGRRPPSNTGRSTANGGLRGSSGSWGVP